MLPTPGILRRRRREAQLEALDAMATAGNALDAGSVPSAGHCCRCCLSFAALLQRPSSLDVTAALGNGATPSSPSLSGYSSALKPSPSKRARSVGGVGQSQLPPEYVRTALSAALPLHRCEAHRLIKAMPEQYHNAQWVPLFDTRVDGYSLPHFYRSLDQIREHKPHLKAAIGFFEVLTREQWEAAAAAASSTSHSIPSTEHAAHHMSIYDGANTATGPSFGLYTASPSVSLTNHDGLLSPPPQRNVPTCGGGEQHSAAAIDDDVSNPFLSSSFRKRKGVRVSSDGGSDGCLVKSPLTSPSLKPVDRSAVLNRVASWTLSASPTGRGGADGRPPSPTALLSIPPRAAVPAPPLPPSAVASAAHHYHHQSSPVDGAKGCDGSVTTQLNLSTPSVIGVFTPLMPSLDHGPHHFFGSRDTAIFAFTDVQKELEELRDKARQRKGTREHTPSSEAPKAGVSGQHLPRHFRYHKWSGRNEEFLICSPHFLGIGGGEDGAALYIDEDIQFGTSADYCPTFGGSTADNSERVASVAERVTRARAHEEALLGGVARQAASIGASGPPPMHADHAHLSRSSGSPPSPHGSSGGSSRALFGNRIAGLRQSEFFVVRMQWFGIDEERYVDLCRRDTPHSPFTPSASPSAGNGGCPEGGTKRGVSDRQLLRADEARADNTIIIPRDVLVAIAEDVGSVNVLMSEGGGIPPGKVPMVCGCGAEGKTIVHRCDGY